MKKLLCILPFLFQMHCSTLTSMYNRQSPQIQALCDQMFQDSGIKKSSSKIEYKNCLKDTFDQNRRITTYSALIGAILGTVIGVISSDKWD